MMRGDFSTPGRLRHLVTHPPPSPFTAGLAGCVRSQMSLLCATSALPPGLQHSGMFPEWSEDTGHGRGGPSQGLVSPLVTKLQGPQRKSGHNHQSGHSPLLGC